MRTIEQRHGVAEEQENEDERLRTFLCGCQQPAVVG